MKIKFISLLAVFPTVLFYAQNGKVGINTTTPGNTLEIKSDSNGTSGLRFSNLNSSSNTSEGKPLGVNSSGDVVTITGGATVLSKTFTLTDSYIAGHLSQNVSNDSSISSNLLSIDDGILMDVLIYSAAEYVPRIKNLTGNTINVAYVSNIDISVVGNTTATDVSVNNGSSLSLSSAPVSWVAPTNSRIVISINNTSWYELKWFCYTKGIPGVKYIFISAQRIL